MKIMFKKQIFLIILLSFCITFLYSENVSKCGWNVKPEINSYLEDVTNNKIFNGSVLVAKNGKILFAKGYGMVNFEEMIPNKSKTVYMIASLTKSFTAYSILLLEQRGLLSINDTVDMYVPELNAGDQITIHQLLSHSSGLFEALNNPVLWAVIEEFHYPLELLPYFADQPLVFPPGTQFSYCNSNYILLGIIIERVTGMTFEDFIKKNITRPLKLRNTGFSPYENYPQPMAAGYDDIKSDPPVLAIHISPTVAYSTGGMYSNVFDLFTWTEGLFTHFRSAGKTKIPRLSPERLEKMFTPGLGDYGYGWFIMDMPVNDKIYKIITHPGEYLGYQGLITRIVDENLTIILQENHTDATAVNNVLMEITLALADIVLH